MESGNVIKLAGGIQQNIHQEIPIQEHGEGRMEYRGTG
jgi:hypothetical protein